MYLLIFCVLAVCRTAADACIHIMRKGVSLMLNHVPLGVIPVYKWNTLQLKMQNIESFPRHLSDLNVICLKNLNIKEWKNSTCWLVWIVIVKLWFSFLSNLKSYRSIITHPQVTNYDTPSNLWKPLTCTVNIKFLLLHNEEGGYHG